MKLFHFFQKPGKPLYKKSKHFQLKIPIVRNKKLHNTVDVKTRSGRPRKISLLENFAKTLQEYLADTGVVAHAVDYCQFHQVDQARKSIPEKDWELPLLKLAIIQNLASLCVLYHAPPPFLNPGESQKHLIELLLNITLFPRA